MGDGTDERGEKLLVLALLNNGERYEAIAEALAASDRRPGDILCELFRAGIETPDDERPPLSRLTPRECDVLILVAEGRPNKQIERALDLSKSAVKHHVEGILQKLSAESRTEAAVVFTDWRARTKSPAVAAWVDGPPRSRRDRPDNVDRAFQMNTKISALFAGHIARAVAVAAVIAGVVAVGALYLAAGTQPGVTLGGADAGVRSVDPGLASAPNASNEANGITVTVTGFVADATRSVVGVEISGRTALGDTALPLTPLRLIDQDGNVYYENGGTADQDNRRSRTIYFPPLPSQTTHLTLAIDGLDFISHAAVVSAVDSAHVNHEPLKGPWSVNFDVTAPIAGAEAVEIGGGTKTFGTAGSLTVTGITQAPTETVIDGYVSGFSMDEIPEMLLHAELKLAGATSPTPFIGLRTGFGPNREQFEVRFPRKPGAATLRIWAESDSQPHDAAAAASLGAKLGANAEAVFSLDLPS